MSAVICAHPSGSWHASTCEGAGGRGSPAAFRSWASLLPGAVLDDHEDQAAYVKTRSVHNMNFFGDVQNDLTGMTKGLRIQMLAHDPGATQLQPDAQAKALSNALRSLLQGLHIGRGFLMHREQHKAMVLLHLCVEVSDHLMAQMGPGDQLFWQVLCRMCLGDAYVRFQKIEEAMPILEEGLKLLEHPEVQPLGASAKVAGAACHQVLCGLYLQAAVTCEHESNERVFLGLAEINQAMVLLEAHLPEVPGVTERGADVAAAAALASAYSTRAVCEVRLSNFEESYSWFDKAQAAVQDFSRRSRNARRILDEVAQQVEHAKQLHNFS